MLEDGAESVDAVRCAWVIPDAGLSEAGAHEPIERMARWFDR
jgi:hypothetical protein